MQEWSCVVCTQCYIAAPRFDNVKVVRIDNSVFEVPLYLGKERLDNPTFWKLQTNPFFHVTPSCFGRKQGVKFFVFDLLSHVRVKNCGAENNTG